ncbi:hypothetical protein PL75_11170, partial [Neisseria arctica]
FNGYTLIYGAFAANPVFLLWLPLFWMMAVSGGVLTGALSSWQGEAFRRGLELAGRYCGLF